MRCCGVNGRKDWANIMPGDGLNPNEVQLPDSCARGSNGNTTEFYEDGCFDRMAYVVSQSAMLVATGAVTVAFVQVSDV